MKSLYRSSYRFFKPEQKPETILALSDIHFGGRSSADMHRALVFARNSRKHPELKLDAPSR